MADGGMKKWTTLRKAAGIRGVSIRFSLNVENEQDDARYKGEGNRIIARNVSKASKTLSRTSAIQLDKKKNGDDPRRWARLG